MDINLIEALAKIANEQGLTALEITEGNKKIRIEKNAPVAAINESPKETKHVSEQVTINANPENEEEEGIVDFNRLTEIKSPFVGVFYSAPAKDAKPFVKVGDKIKKGDVLCIIESMKLLNEITAECEGEIVDICVQNGQVVEFSQILFKIF